MSKRIHKQKFQKKNKKKKQLICGIFIRENGLLFFYGDKLL